MSQSASERRTGRRRRPRAPLHSKLALDLPADVQAVASGGACIRLPFAPDVGSSHAFTFQIGTESIRARGVVRNCRRVPGAEAFEVGIEFEGLGLPEQARLEAFVKAKLGR